MKKVLIADIETNHYDFTKLTTFHCLGAVDFHTGEEILERNINKAVDILNSYDVLVFHNGIEFDVPALEQLSGKKITPEIQDTLVIARTQFPLPKKYDLDNKIYDTQFNHSLKSWGVRLGFRKQEFYGGFDTFTKEMGHYCLQDCRVTKELYKFLLEHESLAPEAVRLEHKMVYLLRKMQKSGVSINKDKMLALTRFFKWYQWQLRQDINKIVPIKIEPKGTASYFYIDIDDERHMATTKTQLLAELKATDLVYFKKDIHRGGSMPKLIEFNPNSADDIINLLESKYNWQPSKYSQKSGKACVKAEVLNDLNYYELEPIKEYRKLGKYIGFIESGVKSWSKLVTDEGKIHGKIVHIGTPHSRCSHHDPNLAQVPTKHVLYGEPLRDIFQADDDYVMVGWDASGLQLRCLAHWLGFYDKGEYAKQIVAGDIHTYNQKLAGLQTREQAKHFIYALLFGAMGNKIAQITGISPEESEQLLYNFKCKLPALPHLERLIEAKFKDRGYFLSLDKRPVYSSSKRLLLNYLLTSTEAILMKHALLYIDEEMQKKGYKWDEDYHFSLFCHDEVQANVKPHAVKDYTELCKNALRIIGERFKLNCPLASDVKIGKSWKETH